MPLSYDHLLSHCHHPLARRLGYNGLGDKGVTELAVILNKTKITYLECAPAPEQRLLSFLSAPVDTRLLSHTLPPPIPCSLGNNHIRDQGAIALALILKETNITCLECAATSNRLPSVRFCVSAH